MLFFINHRVVADPLSVCAHAVQVGSSARTAAGVHTACIHGCHQCSTVLRGPCEGYPWTIHQN